AEEPVLEAGTVDLAVAAQAAHWFDWPRYLAEVERVTRPGALVALVAYAFMHVDGSPESDELVTAYYRDDVGPYWPQGREHIESGYGDLVWPWPEVPAAPIAMTASWTRDELLGYIATWSATVRHVNERGPAAYERLGAKLAAIWPDG